MKGTTCPIPVLHAPTARSAPPIWPRASALPRTRHRSRLRSPTFEAYCRETGHALLAWSEENGVFSFVIRRRAPKTRSRAGLDGCPPPLIYRIRPVSLTTTWASTTQSVRDRLRAVLAALEAEEFADLLRESAPQATKER